MMDGAAAPLLLMAFQHSGGNFPSASVTNGVNNGAECSCYGPITAPAGGRVETDVFDQRCFDGCRCARRRTTPASSERVRHSRSGALTSGGNRDAFKEARLTALLRQTVRGAGALTPPPPPPPETLR